MGCAHPPAAVAVKVFVEKNIIAEVFVGLKQINISEHRPFSVLIFFENIDHSLRQIISDLLERLVVSGSCRVFYLKIVSIVMMKTFKGFNQEKVYGKPNRSTPIGI